MSYYDVDAILTDSQKLPCTFQLDVPGLGYLDGSPGETVCTLLSNEEYLRERLTRI
jgi:GINS complex subunit 3